MSKRILSKYSVCYGCNITYHIVCFSPARDLPQPSLSEGSSLPPEMAESETPPRAPSPITVDDTEVLSRRTSPGHGGASEAAEKAPNTMVEALRCAAIVEGHRTLMGVVVEKIQSAKSGLNESFTSLLTGFEVCNIML